MQLVTQAELARHLDLTRSRVGQLLKQGIFAIQDTEHKLLDRDYCTYRYELYKNDNIGHVERHKEEKEQKLYTQIESKVNNELRTRLNKAFDKALPIALEEYKTCYDYDNKALTKASDHVMMFYHEFLTLITGKGTSTYVESNNPELMNNQNGVIVID